MAISLGDLFFGVGADTEGLEKAIEVLNRFSRKVDQVARAQGKHTAEEAKALARREAEMKRAIQQTVELNSEIRRAGGEKALRAALDSNIQAMQQFILKASNAKLTTAEFTRAQSDLSMALGKSRRALKDFRAQRGVENISRMGEYLRDMESAAVLALGPLSGLGARIRSMGAIATRSNIKLAIILGTIVGTGVAVTRLTKAIVQNEQEWQRWEASIAIAMRSHILAEETLVRLADTSLELGAAMKDVVPHYAKMSLAAKQAGMSNAVLMDIFRGFTAASTVLRLSQEQTQGVFRAIEQMMSKGVVQAEELRGQLSERLPGAFAIAAKAMGVTTQELNQMLQRGEVLASDMLPKMAKILADVFEDEARQIRSASLAANRLSTSWTQLMHQLNRITQANEAWVDILEDTEWFIDKIAKGAKSIADALKRDGTETQKLIKDLERFLNISKKLGSAPAEEIDALVSKTSARIKILWNELGRLQAQEVQSRRFYERNYGAAYDERDLPWGARQSIEKRRADIRALQQEIARLELLLRNLQTLSREDIVIIRSKGFEQTKNKIRELIKELTEYQQKLAKVTQGETDTSAIDAFYEAGKLLEKVPDKELGFMSEFLRDLGWSGATAQEQLAQLIQSLKLTEGSYEALLAKLKATPGILKRAEQEFLALQRQVDRFRKSPEAFAMQNKELTRLDQMTAKYRQQLEKAAISTDEIDRRVAEFRATARAFLDAEAWAKSFNETLRRGPKVLYEYGSEIERLRKHIEAMREGPRVFRDLQKELKADAAVKRFADALNSIDLPDETVRALIAYLRQLYVEFDKTERALKRQADLSNSLASSMESIFTDAIMNMQDTLENFEDVARQVFDAIRQEIIKTFVTEPLSNWLGDFIAGMFGGYTVPGTSDTVGFAPGTPVPTTGAQGANVNTPMGMGAGTNTLTGADFGSNTTTGMGFGVNGKAAEVLASMLRRGSLGRYNTLGMPVQLQIIDQRGADAPQIEVEQTRRGDGTLQIQAIVRGAVKQALANGKLDKAFSRTYGLRRRAR